MLGTQAKKDDSVYNCNDVLISNCYIMIQSDSEENTSETIDRFSIVYFSGPPCTIIRYKVDTPYFHSHGMN